MLYCASMFAMCRARGSLEIPTEEVVFGEHVGDAGSQLPRFEFRAVRELIVESQCECKLRQQPTSIRKAGRTAVKRIYSHKYWWPSWYSFRRVLQTVLRVPHTVQYNEL